MVKMLGEILHYIVKVCNLYFCSLISNIEKNSFIGLVRDQLFGVFKVQGKLISLRRIGLTTTLTIMPNKSLGIIKITKKCNAY